MEQSIPNLMFFETEKNIRPATLAETVKANINELFNRCDDGMVLVHVHVISNIIDDMEAINQYAIRELTIIDARDTVNRFADERRPETAAAIAYAESLQQ